MKQQNVILTHLQPSFHVSHLSSLTSGEFQDSKITHSSRVLLSPYLHPFLCKLGIHCFLEDIPNILQIFSMLLQHVKPMVCHIIKRIKYIYIPIHQAHPYLSTSHLVLEFCHNDFTLTVNLGLFTSSR